MKSKLDKETKCQIVQAEFKECINRLYRYNTRMKFNINRQTVLIVPLGPDIYSEVYVMIGRWPFRQIALCIVTDRPGGGSTDSPKLISFKEKYLPLLPAIISKADEIEMIVHHQRQSQEELMTTRKESYADHIRQIVKK